MPHVNLASAVRATLSRAGKRFQGFLEACEQFRVGVLSKKETLPSSGKVIRADGSGAVWSYGWVKRAW